MPENKKVHYIPAKPPKRDKRVGIYCRVSTNSLDQLKKSNSTSFWTNKISSGYATVVTSGCIYGYCIQ